MASDVSARIPLGVLQVDLGERADPVVGRPWGIRLAGPGYAHYRPTRAAAASSSSGWSDRNRIWPAGSADGPGDRSYGRCLAFVPGGASGRTSRRSTTPARRHGRERTNPVDCAPNPTSTHVVAMPASCQAVSAGGASAKNSPCRSPLWNPSAQIRPCAVFSGSAFTSEFSQPHRISATPATSASGRPASSRVWAITDAAASAAVVDQPAAAGAAGCSRTGPRAPRWSGWWCPRCRRRWRRSRDDELIQRREALTDRRRR